MEEKKELYMKEIRPGVWLMDEAHEATGYLVVGERKACVIDTMNGYCDLGEAVRKLTDKPVTQAGARGSGFLNRAMGQLAGAKKWIQPRQVNDD